MMRLLKNNFYINSLWRLVLVMSFLSCSSTHFISQGKSHISLVKLINPAVHDEIEVKREFYLWGTVPSQQLIDVDSILMENHHLKISEVSISQYRNYSDYIFTFITLGLYAPVHYKFEFRGDRYESDEL